MEFGVFDYLDLSGSPIERFYRERLELVEAYERAGFHAYHVAEHHLTHLGMAPSPSVFLAAAAQRTRRLRLVPMVFVAPHSGRPKLHRIGSPSMLSILMTRAPNAPAIAMPNGMA